ncbi:MAG: phosphoribosylformylglycinamidine synthase I [Elusimicrobiales bacterium]|nr:phosphoribosylformylglycinamidine synthase I [Elusimicrobiales bacterium]
MKTPKVLIVRAPGTNCDMETADSFKYLGAKPELAHIARLTSGAVKIGGCDILVFPGGFSYGDYIAAGRIVTAQLEKIASDLKKFIASGRPVIGICNGFQVLVKAGFLPFSGRGQQASFTFNDNGHFTAKWVRLRINKNSPCLFAKGLPDEIELPIAHGEGKFVAQSPEVLGELKAKNCIAFRYVKNPNGSQEAIAGLSNPEGNCLGIMPHPERYAFPFQHPAWHRHGGKYAAGLEILRNAVKHVS